MHASLCRITRQMLDADILTNGKSGSVSSSAKAIYAVAVLPIREFVPLQTFLTLHPILVEKQEAARQA